MKKFVLFILFFVIVYNIQVYAGVSVKASSEESSELSADKAFDGDRSTRWSSIFADNQWIEIDIGKIQDITGFDIYWEAAYTKEYDILVSENGTDWFTVYTTAEGDGKVDNIDIDKISTRYVRIDCKKRGTEWGNSIYEIVIKRTGKMYIDEPGIEKIEEIIEKKYLSPKQIKEVTSSSIQEERFPAQYAVDGDMSTRWSSNFSDPQWVKIDLGAEHEITGLIIKWETAFGKAYDILLSENNKDWKKVFSTDDGDGNTDIIFFKKQSARYIKIFGRKRGTGWGYSIYEVKILKGKWAPSIEVSSNPDLSYNILDGNPETVWTGDKNNSQEIIIDFKEPIDLGGLFIYWDDCITKHRSILISDDKENWNRIYSSDRVLNQPDYIFTEMFSGRYLKIEVTAEKGPVKVKEITLKGQDERVSNQKILEIAAIQSKKGLYPRWLRKQQEYWTVTGVVDDDQESLISEDGVIEPWHYSHTVAPFIEIDGEIITYADVETEQFLENDYLPLPGVRWKHNNFEMVIKAYAADKGQRSSTYVKYTITNKTARNLKGKFILALRPYQLNPPWMHGGLASIKKINYASKTANSMIKINDRNVLYVPEKPDRYTTYNFGSDPDISGDIMEALNRGELAAGSENFNDESGLGSAALTYLFDINPGQSKNFYFIIPLHNEDNDIAPGIKYSGKYFDEKYKIIKNFWVNKLKSIRITLPDKEFTDTLKTNVAYILINDDSFRLQPGSRNYESSWMRDGSVMAVGLLRMGLVKEVTRYLKWISGFIKDDGWVPFIVDNNDEIVTHGWKEFDSQGQYIYAIYQYYQFTKDIDFLKACEGKIYSDIYFMKERANERKTAEYQDYAKKEYYGIFPESASHEGYIDPPRHSYWDDFWGLRGLNDAVKIFKLLGEKDKSNETDEFRKEFQKNVYNSIKLVIKKRGITYIPGCAELGDCDPTSTAIAMWPCNEMKNLPVEPMKATFRIYWKSLNDRFNNNWQGGFTPYEIRNANAFILTGQRDKLYRMITKFFEWKRPRKWNHWAEVVTSDYRLPQYLGDMPHTWISSTYTNVIRNMLILEDEEVLYLGKGIVKEWIEPGKEISVKNMPTNFGPVSYSLKSEQNVINIKVDGEIQGAHKVVFVIPPVDNIKSIRVDGRGYNKIKTGEIEIRRLPAVIKIERQN